MTLFTALTNLATGYGFDVTAEESPIRVAPLESGTAAEVTVEATGQTFVVNSDNVSLAAMAGLFHSVRQHSRSVRLLTEAVSAAAPMPEWAV